MYIIKLRNIVGLAGVDKDENALAVTWGHRFELAMILIAIWLPLQWYLERAHEIIHPLAELCSWLVWLFFVAETITMLVLTTHKINYMLKNWMNLVIIILGVPPIWMQTPWLAMLRILQLLLVLRLLLPVWDSTVKILSRNRLGTTLIVACILTVFWGVLMSILDPDIKTPWDGIWLAWETVTTVGFGDIVPTSVIGRLLDIVLMIMGVALISLLTANFSAYFIGQSTEALKREEDEMCKMMRDLQKQMAEIQQQLKQLNENKEN